MDLSNEELAELLERIHESRTAEEWDGDRGDCPYYARNYELEGYDPDGICSYGCREEPACITSEPWEGWINHLVDPAIKEAAVRLRETPITDGLKQARESARKLPESLQDAVRRSGTASTFRSRDV